MKKIKIFLAVIVCALCLCLPLSACSSLKNYVEDSLTANCRIYSRYFDIVGEFKVKIDAEGTYTVEYTLNAETNKGTYSVTDSTDITVQYNGEYIVSYNVVINADDVTEVSQVYLKNLKITSKNGSTSDGSNSLDTLIKVNSEVMGYALGFSIPCTLILFGLIAVFVLDKTGAFKNNKDKK